MTDNEGLRAKSRDELVDEIDSRRAELQRRADEALEGLELAFGPREPEARGAGRPKGSKNKGTSSLSEACSTLRPRSEPSAAAVVKP